MNNLGLLLACFGSVFNVLTDCSRKKILDHGYDAVIIGFWCKAAALSCYLIALGVLLFLGIRPELPPVGAALHLSPKIAFLIYLIINALLEGTAILLNYRALQVSPLSFCVPFMALTPVFLLPIGKFFLHEQISSGMIVGVFLVVTGSLVINRQLVANGWLEPAKAILREKGSRYMIIVAMLLACTAAIDKWFVTGGGDAELGARVLRSFSLSLGKSMMLGLFFLLLASWRLSRKPREESQTGSAPVWTAAWRDVPGWILLAGLFEATVLILQMVAVQLTVAAIVISIKRSGILLACVLGWFMFKERGITDRVIGSFVMISGVVVFFLTKPDTHGSCMIGFSGAVGVAALALAGMSLALYLTRNWNKPTDCQIR
jgi:drug/metabolite transporter (DMT)-like permease